MRPERTFCDGAVPLPGGPRRHPDHPTARTPYPNSESELRRTTLESPAIGPPRQQKATLSTITILTSQTISCNRAE